MASAIRLQPALLISAIALFLLPQHVISQDIKLQGDIGIQYTHFRAASLPGVSNGRPGLTLRMGAAYNFGKSDQYFVGAEMGVYTRRMKRTVDEYYFINRFFTAEFAVVLKTRIAENWFAETGLAFLSSVVGQSQLIDAEGAAEIFLGRGYQNFDLAPFIGGAHKVADYIAIGARARFGLLPMVEYQIIGNYGELSPAQTDLYSSTFEVFIRISNF